MHIHPQDRNQAEDDIFDSESARLRCASAGCHLSCHLRSREAVLPERSPSFSIPTLTRRAARSISLCATCACGPCPTTPSNGYIKAGVILDDLLPEADQPAMLFQRDRLRDAHLTDALDTIIDHFGKKDDGAGMRRLRRRMVLARASPLQRYTIRIRELPSV